MDFAKLKNIRKTNKITLITVAKKTGIGRCRISDIEKGKANPTINTLEAICKAINANLDIS